MKEILIALMIVAFFSCKKSKEKNELEPTPTHKSNSNEIESLKSSIDSISITYHLENTKKWWSMHKTDSLHQAISFAINRTDRTNFLRMDSVIVPTDFSYDLMKYLPLPNKVNYIKDIKKIIYFSYPTQTFGAYEKGILVYTGPTNMGREDHPTPVGLFFTNWKAIVSTSTINEQWILKWNFNISNTEGIGWHEYSLPGYPVSHSCLRLQEKDAHYLYNWADEWVLADQYNILVKGTPVIVFGKYDFTISKPWQQLIYNPQAMDITADEIQRITQPFLDEILTAQKERDSYRRQTAIDSDSSFINHP